MFRRILAAVVFAASASAVSAATIEAGKTYSGTWSVDVSDFPTSAGSITYSNVRDLRISQIDWFFSALDGLNIGESFAAELFDASSNSIGTTSYTSPVDNYTGLGLGISGSATTGIPSPTAGTLVFTTGATTTFDLPSVSIFVVADADYDNSGSTGVTNLVFNAIVTDIREVVTDPGPAAVPLPATLPLLLLGFFGLIAFGGRSNVA